MINTLTTTNFRHLFLLIGQKKYNYNYYIKYEASDMKFKSTM